LRPFRLLALLKRAFTSELSAVRSPITAVGYNYVVKLQITTVGLSPTRPIDSFAAPPLETP
ncbi:hypothetical protein M1O56_06420, partial [Dehalococcoidia bacterium]|nr:hypothetical protein [Dehalococcoidia bacterium]